MSSIDALTASIRAAIERTREAVSSLTISKEIAGELRGELAQVGVETKAHQAGAISDGLENQRALVASAAERLEELLAAAEALRTGSRGAGGGGTPPGPPLASTPVGPSQPFGRPIEGFSPKRVHPEPIARLRREGWPSNAEGRTSARAFLYDHEGRQTREKPYQAHRKGEAPTRPDLKEPWASDPELAITWHAESDAAADLRQTGPGQYALYVNIPPCGRVSEDPQRCHANLEKVLPPGATLYVWQISENGGMTRFMYRGTGEAIKDD